MKGGDIFWVEFAPGGAGRAQSGRRPAVVVQAEAASRNLPTVLVVPLTTQVEALRFPGTVIVSPDRQNGLTRTSVALAYQLTAVDARLLRQTVGFLSAQDYRSVWSAIEAITDRPAGSSERVAETGA